MVLVGLSLQYPNSTRRAVNNFCHFRWNFSLETPSPYFGCNLSMMDPHALYMRLRMIENSPKIYVFVMSSSRHHRWGIGVDSWNGEILKKVLIEAPELEVFKSLDSSVFSINIIFCIIIVIEYTNPPINNWQKLAFTFVCPTICGRNPRILCTFTLCKQTAGRKKDEKEQLAAMSIIIALQLCHAPRGPPTPLARFQSGSVLTWPTHALSLGSAIQILLA